LGTTQVGERVPTAKRKPFSLFISVEKRRAKGCGRRNKAGT